MQQDKIRESTRERNYMIKMLKQLREDGEVIEMVTKLEYNPVQSLEERYQYLKLSESEENFEFFNKIAQILADNFKYSVQDSDDIYECCVYYGNNAYDFELILSLARFYQTNETLFEGHIDIIKRMCDETSDWEKIKEFWLKNTIKK